MQCAAHGRTFRAHFCASFRALPYSRPVKRLTLVFAGVLFAGLLTVASTAAMRSSGSQARHVIAVGELPGDNWAFPLRDDQLGRIAKAFPAAHAVCEERSTRLPTPASVNASFFTRLGHGLSTVGGLAAVYRSERDARAVFHATLTPRIAGCLAQALTGSAGDEHVEAWVVPSPLGRAAPGSRVARIALVYEAGAEHWRGHLDLVDVRAGKVWGLFVFFASEPSQADRYELALLRSALPGLAATRSTQASRGSARQAAPKPRATLNQSLALTTSVLGWVNESCPLDAVTLPRAIAALNESLELLRTLNFHDTAVERAFLAEAEARDNLVAGLCSVAVGALQQADDFKRRALGEQ